MNDTAKTVNWRISEVCSLTDKLSFISWPEFSPSSENLLAKDGLHLSHEGTYILSKKFQRVCREFRKKTPAIVYSTLCFSTKYISFVMEYIVSMAVQCSDVDLIQCQKIYTLCFVSTKYICVVTEHISMAVQRSDIDSTPFHIVCCLYSLNGYDSVSEDLYFVFRFDQIYLFCH